MLEQTVQIVSNEHDTNSCSRLVLCTPQITPIASLETAATAAEEKGKK
jgi:hypothetical protein